MTEPPEKHGAIILIVDDERTIADLLSRSMAQRGFSTRVAYSAAEAKQVLAAEPDVFVMLSDVRMPGQDGLSLAEEVLSARGEADATEVVLLTGNADAEAAISALRSRVFDMIQKPFNLGHVSGVVRRAEAAAAARRQRAGRDAALRTQIEDAEAERERLVARLEASSAATDGQARDDLIAVISHELRTPLIPVIGLSELLLEQPELSPKEVAAYSRAIHEGGRRLLGMIDRALDIVGMDRGLREADRERFPVAVLAARAVARAAEAAAAGQVHIVRHGDAVCVGVGDMALLQKALEQLLDNAVRASPESAEVVMCWRTADDTVRIAVRDHGDGISDTVIARLGTLFLQADQSRSRAWEGAGLGLAFAHRVAVLHGGGLQLSRPPEGGTLAVLVIAAEAFGA
jgi:signal transduction histidine kinase